MCFSSVIFQDFDANSDQYMTVTNWFVPSIYGKFIRVHITACNNYCRLRMELYGKRNLTGILHYYFSRCLLLQFLGASVSTFIILFKSDTLARSKGNRLFPRLFPCCLCVRTSLRAKPFI